MISHVAIWVSDLEKMRSFYAKYFGGIPNDLYHNPAKDFYSYFLSFKSGPTLELMQMPAVNECRSNPDKEYIGLAHLCFGVGSKEKVDGLTKQLVGDGYTLLSGPKVTGDGHYESCIYDPELNRVEITV